MDHFRNLAARKRVSQSCTTTSTLRAFLRHCCVMQMPKQPAQAVITLRSSGENFALMLSTRRRVTKDDLMSVSWNLFG